MGRRERGSLDAWATLAALAARTSRLRLGTLVSPATFRHPSVLARAAVTVDHVSSGRVELGMGAGWFEQEHLEHGFPFPEAKVRIKMLAEQLEIMHRSWREQSFTFEGEHYRLEECRARPKPVQQPHPPVIVGGRGGATSLALAARWADEYNTVFAGPERCRQVGVELEEAWKRAGRTERAVLSLMTCFLIGEDEEGLTDHAKRLMDRTGRPGDPREFLQQVPEWIFGTPERFLDRLRELEAAGVERIMLQHLVHDDLETVALIGREIVPQVA
jgi:alkanesulfonate monooxygenase SsuD/methylene tetrahydromethanopterin reductase-like flavin-dependent oxidoreductase (luciferase family)